MENSIQDVFRLKGLGPRVAQREANTPRVNLIALFRTSAGATFAARPSHRQGSRVPFPRQVREFESTV
jgi:hypothetical protein